MKPQLLKIHPADNVAVAVDALEADVQVDVDGEAVTLQTDVPAGHKVALRDLPEGTSVVKYGFPIGHTTADVRQGEHLHAHNLQTDLGDHLEYQYEPRTSSLSQTSNGGTFQGYERPNGKVGTRNEIWVLNTVGCVNRSAERIARMSEGRFAHVDGVHAFSHPYGCSQLGDDLQYTRRVLAGLIRHPNVGGVLVLGLGCENNQMGDLLEEAGDVDESRIRFFNAQDVLDEVEAGLEAVEALAEMMRTDVRTERPLADLVVGLKCGGSDGFSGITANPLVGRLADRIAAHGGTALLTEVPEMFGAEQVLMNRAVSEDVFADVARMINGFKDYFTSHGQPIYENPSPGNKAGGLTTLEEKSLGAIQKGGQAPVAQVLRYGEPARPGLGGLALVEAPGNDGVSSTAMTAAGATVLLFTTGRGTPLGFPAPTVKVSTNSALHEQKPQWIDFNAGALLDGGRDMESLADDLLDYVVRVASGERTNNEQNDYREIAIWKGGVTL